MWLQHLDLRLSIVLLGLLALTPPARAQTPEQRNAQAALLRLRCAQTADLMNPLGQVMYRRCLAGAGNTGPRLVGPIPQLVHPVGPLITPQTPSRPAGDGCRQGFVWRETDPRDHVCVVPSTRQQARNENRLAASRVNQVDHSYGPDTCNGGFVWREATPHDHVCVPPPVRDQARQDNAAAADRVAR